MILEELLEKLSEKRQMLLLMKANVGYSGVLINREEYCNVILKHHFNGETVEEVIEKMNEK